MPKTTPNEANPTIYNRLVMSAFYRLWVHWISHTLAWRVSNRWLRKSYQCWTGPAHLCIGPGNGHFLRYTSARTHTVQLLDLNPQCLDMGAKTVRATGKRAFAHPPQDVATPWQKVQEESLDSADATMVLHCVRGASLHEKATVFREAHRVLKPNGHFFGATVLSGGPGVAPNLFARLLMRVYNQRTNTFANTGDRSDDLRTVLEEAGFVHVWVGVQGTTGVWTAVKR